MAKKILYFTASEVPTTAEQAEIAALNARALPAYTVGVRTKLQNSLYGAAIEASDFVAGTPPTTIYDAVPAFGSISTNRPAAIAIIPAAPTCTDAATVQLQTIIVNGVDISALTVLDRTATNVAYASDDTNVATVHATSGLVTGVAAGTCDITATYTFDTAKTISVTKTVTITAA